MADRVDHSPPAPGVTEIRVHGVGGANPASMLGRNDIQQVTGDATAGFFRATTPAADNRPVEAYSWGGLTAKGKARALWVLLLPFALVNIAGWMVEPIPKEKEGPHSVPVKVVIWAASKLERIQRCFVHLTALALTGAYVMWAALMSMNLLAYQCGSRAACASGRFYAEFLQDTFFMNRPGRRIFVGALAPLLLLALFAVLSMVSQARYESYTAARLDPSTEEGDPPVLDKRMSATAFWHTSQWHTRLLRAHLAWALSLLSGITAYATWQFVATAPTATEATPGWARTLAALAFVASAMVAGLVVFYIFKSVWLEDQSFSANKTWLDRFAFGLLIGALTVTVLAMIATWQLRANDVAVVNDPASAALRWFGETPIVLFALAVFAVLLFSLVEVAKWTVACQVSPGFFFVAIAGVMILAWPYAFWVFLIALGIAVFARYVETRLCVNPSPIRQWIEIAVPTILLVALQQIGSGRWSDGVWGDAWPRLTPVVLSGAVLFSLFRRYVIQNYVLPDGDGAAGKRPFVAANFPLLATGALLLAGGVLALMFGRPDPMYLACYAAWVLLSFSWIAIQPHPGFRVNGPGAVALLAAALMAGLFSGATIRVISILNGHGYELVSIELYDWLAVGFVAISAAALVSFIAWFIYIWATVGARAKQDFLVRREKLVSTGAVLAPESIADKVRNWVTIARAVEAIDVFIMHISMVTLFASMALVLHFIHEGVPFRDFRYRPLGGSWEELVTAAAWVTLMIALGSVLAVRSGLRDEGFRRQIGIIWDVTSFWPRHFHPFAPPSYAVRTVPELQQRLSEISDGAGAAIVSGHSQGSVVAFAAAASVEAGVCEHVMLVTHGSPLRRFYGRFFPNYFSADLFEKTAQRVGPTNRRSDGSWLNFHRPTDPVAQPIFLTPDNPVEPMPRIAQTLNPELFRHLPDVPLEDPASLIWQKHRRPPDVLWHLNYMSDPLMADAVDALTEILHEELGKLVARRDGESTDEVAGEDLAP